MEMRQHLEQLEQALTPRPQALEGRPLRARCVPVLVSLLVLLSGGSVWAADAQGRYLSVGIGGVGCQTLAQTMQDLGEVPFQHWFAGYVTGLNLALHDTYDLGGLEAGFLMAFTDWRVWIEHYCRLNPVKSVMDANQAWIDKRLQRRQSSEPQEVLQAPPVAVPPRSRQR